MIRWSESQILQILLSYIIEPEEEAETRHRSYKAVYRRAEHVKDAFREFRRVYRHFTVCRYTRPVCCCPGQFLVLGALLLSLAVAAVRLLEDFSIHFIQKSFKDFRSCWKRRCGSTRHLWKWYGCDGCAMRAEFGMNTSGDCT